jgi:mono/diheme cytochrome c family protein
MENSTPLRRFPKLRAAPLSVRLGLIATIAAGGAVTAHSIVPNYISVLREVDEPAFAEISHQDQAALNAEAQAVANLGDRRVTLFTKAFDHGDELFELQFNALDGGGAYVSPQQRYTRFPRPDLRENGWFTHAPGRATGPNGGACIECHNQNVADGPGPASANVHRDPFRTGRPENYIQRNTPHVHGAAGKQRLAEEMTALLLQRRDAGAPDCVCRDSSRSNPPCAARRVFLNEIKGVDFGSAIVSRKPGATSCSIQVIPPQGFTTKAVSDDLVVRPFQWKGSVAFIRDFNRGAMHNELGMQAVEFFDRANVDGDRDGVAEELTVGDITALTLYIAGQPRPTSKLELQQIRGSNRELAALVPALPGPEIATIQRGQLLFDQITCNQCHRPAFSVDDRLFREPSASPDYRDRVFPGGRLPAELGLFVQVPVTFDITNDQPDNKFDVGEGQNRTPLGSFKRTGQAGAIIEPYTDLRRHNLGDGLAEPVDEVGTGKAVFLTTALWGVGSSAPYLHDGRAVTLTEAILWHEGEGESSRAAFLQLPAADKKAVIAFLNNLILFLPAEEDGGEEED